MIFDCSTEAINRLRTIKFSCANLFIIRRLIIITLLVEAALNKACCVGVARRRHRSFVGQTAETFSN